MQVASTFAGECEPVRAAKRLIAIQHEVTGAADPVADASAGLGGALCGHCVRGALGGLTIALVGREHVEPK